MMKRKKPLKMSINRQKRMIKIEVKNLKEKKRGNSINLFFISLYCEFIYNILEIF